MTRGVVINPDLQGGLIKFLAEDPKWTKETLFLITCNLTLELFVTALNAEFLMGS